ncbi:sensor histidine kinase [Alteromonas gilva]|uniref:Histidine kinase n=1 Tax=Alteromonas gilva TaxID=2987522 RepID=A0ABT5KYV3_9ALTE|nr:histidine kinase [Alteromonas gilva]MDC8829436.1 histidine kinase [Alteromonas gilva]
MKQYWWFQIIGWGVFYLSDTLLKISVGVVDMALFMAVLILYVYGWLVSHAMRHWYRKWRRHNLIVVVLEIFAVSLLGAAAATSLMLATLVVIQHPIIGQAAGSLDLLFLNNCLVLWVVLVIWSGLYCFITRQRKVDELESVQVGLEHTLQQAKLSALLTQLNPHFMFNCINNIRALILEDTGKARDMLADLADMLRYNLQSDAGEKSTLESELSIVTTYISLMKMQYEKRLNYQVEVDDEVNLQSCVPRLLLQLLVENAIKHGIATLADGGSVAVKVSVAEQRLCIDVINPGVFKPGDSGIGVTNIRQRLQLLYAGRQLFTLQQVGDQVVAHVEIPVEDNTCA